MTALVIAEHDKQSLKGGTMVKDVGELVDKLKNEAKVI